MMMPAGTHAVRLEVRPVLRSARVCVMSHDSCVQAVCEIAACVH